MILEDLSIYESCIDGKMIKRTRAKECLELVHTDMFKLLVMITLGLDMYIGDLMPWIHSLNLRRDWITY